jgi:hypothetical protein
MSSEQTQIVWKTKRWLDILKNLQKAAEKSAKEISKIDNPVIDAILAKETQDYLVNQFPTWLKQDGADLYKLIEELARKVIPLAESHVSASEFILNTFFYAEEIQKSPQLKSNNIEFLRKLIFCLEEPIDTETSLSDAEFRMLERLLNAFSDRLKFNPNKKDLAVREDLITVAFRKQGLTSGSIPRQLQKVSKFVGLITEEIKFYDPMIGRERKTYVYKFHPEFENLLDKLGLIEEGFEGSEKVRYLSDELPIEILYSFIQGWRAVNLEAETLGDFLINGICNILAYTILVSLPEGKISDQDQVEQSSVLLADNVCHPLIIALSQAIAYVIHGDNWYGVIWTSPKKSKYHRSVRYVLVGSLIKIQAGNILLKNNTMTNYIRSYTVRVGQELGGT